jgi:hypothetical protein
VIQDLLKDLAQDNPGLNGTKAKTAEAGERKETSKQFLIAPGDRG